MNLSDSSSEDECNIYVNAASKLNALNRRAKSKIKDDEDQIEEYDDIVAESENIDPTLVNGKQKEDNRSTNDCCNVNLEVEPEKKDEARSTKKDDDLVMCVDDNNYTPCSNNKRKHRRTTRNSNKIDDSIPAHTDTSNNIEILDTPDDRMNIIEDSIEHVLDDTYNDSLNLSQEDNDSYIVIGSPPPAKKCDRENYEVSVKVLWRSDKLERFEIRRYETFQKVFRYFAKLEGVSEDQILITKKDKRITPFDTPLSIDWSIIDILDGGVVSADVAKQNKESPTKDDSEENMCKIKIQTSDKRTLVISVKNDESLTSLAQSCSKQLEIPESKIKFYFDGELIDTSETPESLDFDDEACIDLKISK